MNKKRVSIVFATHNLNKVKEVRSIMPEYIKILSLLDLNCNENIPEISKTLEGNAKIKSDYVKKTYGMDAFADDTGLEVDALSGAPGVYSARYAGEGNNMEKNIDKLLKNLENFKNRTAQFRTVISLSFNGKQYFFNGICKGTILKEKSGYKGFGYDSIFLPKGYSDSFAKMSVNEKSKISHRGKAVRDLISFLKKLY